MAPKPSPSPAKAAATPGTQVLAVLPVDGLVLFPGSKLTLPVKRPGHLALVEEALRDNQEIVVVAQRHGGGMEEAGAEELYTVGTAARVVSVSNRAGGGAGLEVKGVRRVRVVDYVQKSPFLRARVAVVADGGSGAEVEKRALALRAEGAKRLHDESGPEAAARLLELKHPRQIADAVGQLVDAPVESKQGVLEEVDLQARLKKARALLRGQRRGSRSRGLPGRHVVSYAALSGVLGAEVVLSRADWHQPAGAALWAALGVGGLNLLIELVRWLR